MRKIIVAVLFLVPSIALASPISADFFVATDTTATSTFGGAVAVDGQVQFGLSTGPLSTINGLLSTATVQSPFTFASNVFSCLSATGSQSGCLSASDWTRFNDAANTISFATSSAPIPGWPDLISCNVIGGTREFPMQPLGLPGDFGNYMYGVAGHSTDPLTINYNADGAYLSNNFGTTDCDGLSISDLFAAGKAFYYGRSITVTNAPVQSSKRKPVDESISSNSTLHDDSALKVSLVTGKTYSVEGVVFGSATNATPDIKIAFTAPASSDMAIGYMSAAGSTSSGGELQSSGAASTRIPLPANLQVPMTIRGTIIAGATGTLQLQWAQFTSSNAIVKVGKGSYLRVSEIGD